LVTRYAMRSAEAANENQRRVEGVFDELADAKPGNVSYIVLRLADDSFVHVSFHNHGDDELNPIASTAAFAHFPAGPRRPPRGRRRPADGDLGRRLHHHHRLSPRGWPRGAVEPRPIDMCATSEKVGRAGIEPATLGLRVPCSTS